MADTDSSILFVNNLSYTLPTPSSVVTNRVVKRSYFQNRTYGSQSTMIAQWNTGNDFINTKNSKLVLKVKGLGNTVDTSESSFGLTGSGMNLVKNIRIYHRSGTTYTNTQSMNLYRAKVDRCVESPAWFSSIGAPLMGYDRAIVFSNTGVDGTGDTQYVEIPLNKLHPFFQPHGDVMIPSCVASGLRIEIDLEQATSAFQKFGAGSYMKDYTIEDCYFSLESYSLMDSAVASLNTVASTQSLEYLYTDIFTSKNSQPSNTSQLNVDINKSVALASECIGCYQLQSDIGAFASDSFRTEYNQGSWWYLLGSNQFPQVKIDNIKSGYHQALLTFDKFSHPQNDSSLVYSRTGDPSTWELQYGIYAMSLERDCSLALSQNPVNASRSLRFELTYDVPPGEAVLFTIFMTYLSSARSTLLNSRVDV